jgi:RNA polymerase sigma-70 factor (ECF subfamily)
LRKKKLDTHSLDNEKVFDAADNRDSGMRADMNRTKIKARHGEQRNCDAKPDDAAIITLFYKGEQTLDEIAAVLKIESNAAKSGCTGHGQD